VKKQKFSSDHKIRSGQTILIHTTLSLVCFLHQAALVFISFFCIPHFAAASRKLNSYRKFVSHCFAHIVKQGIFGDLCIHFTSRLMKVTFPCADWLRYLRTQLNVFVGTVLFGKQEIFASAVFLNQIFFEG